MTDKEMAKQFADNINGFESTCSLLSAKDKSHAYRLGRYEGFLAGLEAGKPKWYKPSEKLPADCSLVLAFGFEDSEPTLFKFVISNTWEWMPRRIACLSNDQIKCWCEIPKYTEE